MPDIQEQLIRASAIARLGRIMRELETSQHLADAERQWFAELLHPFATNEAGAARLTSSRAVSRAEGGAMLKILQEYMLEHSDFSEFQQYLQSLGRLRLHLLDNGSVEGDLLPPALEVARRLRSHFLRAETPTSPHSARLA